MGDGRLVGVVVDVPALERTLTYRVPDGLVGRVAVGTIVRVPLHGRRVRGWVVSLDEQAPDTVRVADVTKVSGIGPDEAMIDLCRWASWRWAGRLVTFLRAASPDSNVPTLRRSGADRRRHANPDGDPTPTSVVDILSRASAGQLQPGAGQLQPGAVSLQPGAVSLQPGAVSLQPGAGSSRAVLRLPPAADAADVVLGAARQGPALVVCASVGQAVGFARRLRAAGIRVALHPADWALAAGGAVTVVGARGAAFAPVPDLRAVVVVDEHDEAMQSEGSPTWHAREVCLERARRARVPAIMISPTPSLESMSRSPLVTVDRARERAGWPIVEAVDRREDDFARSSLYSTTLVERLRGAESPLCILNRTGRAALLACTACREIARCERCGSSVTQPDRLLWCRRCLEERPAVCLSCGGARFANLRQGVVRAREELTALVGSHVRIGTEAALHDQVATDVVAFLEFDQELSAPRYRAAEQAMTLVARAARLVGGRDHGGRIIIQTRMPDHEVVRAAVGADPGIVSDAELIRRDTLGYPPAATIAALGGEAAPTLADAVEHRIAEEGLALELLGTGTGEWLLRARDRRVLLDLLASIPRPPGRLRLQIDPMRLR